MDICLRWKTMTTKRILKLSFTASVRPIKTLHDNDRSALIWRAAIEIFLTDLCKMTPNSRIPTPINCAIALSSVIILTCAASSARLTEWPVSESLSVFSRRIPSTSGLRGDAGPGSGLPSGPWATTPPVLCPWASRWEKKKKGSARCACRSP